MQQTADSSTHLWTSLGLADHEVVYKATPRFPLVWLRHCTMSVMLSAQSRPRAWDATPAGACRDTDRLGHALHAPAVVVHAMAVQIKADVTADTDPAGERLQLLLGLAHERLKK